jgi:hypothetical protein
MLLPSLLGDCYAQTQPKVVARSVLPQLSITEAIEFYIVSMRKHDINDKGTKNV